MVFLSHGHHHLAKNLLYHHHHFIPCEQCCGEAKDDSNKKTATDHSEEGENANADLKDDGDT